MTVSELPLIGAGVARGRRAHPLGPLGGPPQAGRAIAAPDLGELPPDPAQLLAISAPEAPALNEGRANALLVRALAFACAATIAFDVLLIVTSV
jgi:hypothetical protein